MATGGRWLSPRDTPEGPVVCGRIGKRSQWLRRYNERFAAVLDARWPGGVLGFSDAVGGAFDAPAGATLVWRGGAQSGSIALDEASSITKIVRMVPGVPVPVSP